MDSGDYYVSKMIKLQGLGYLLVFVGKTGTNFEIRVVNLEPEKIETNFKFVYINEEAIEDSERDFLKNVKEGKIKIFTEQDVQRSLLDTLRRYYGSAAIDQAFKICSQYQKEIDKNQNEDYEAPTIFEQMPEEADSIHKTRLVNKFKCSETEKTIVFHRKALFDTDREKLLVLMIRLKYDATKMSEDLRISYMPENFSILINEPESNQEVEFLTTLDSCLTEEELNGNMGDLRELKVLRKLARVVLEERIDMRRNFGDEEQQ